MRHEGSVLHCLDSEGWKKETRMSCFPHCFVSQNKHTHAHTHKPPLPIKKTNKQKKTQHHKKPVFEVDSNGEPKPPGWELLLPHVFGGGWYPYLWV